jgi:hypothetical protein
MNEPILTVAADNNNKCNGEDNGTPKQERQTDGIPHQMARA